MPHWVCSDAQICFVCLAVACGIPNIFASGLSLNATTLACLNFLIFSQDVHMSSPAETHGVEMSSSVKKSSVHWYGIPCLRFCLFTNMGFLVTDTFLGVTRYKEIGVTRYKEVARALQNRRKAL